MIRVWLWIFLFGSGVAKGQQFATTDDGRRVKLNAGGTWEFVQSSSGQPADSSFRIFTKPQASTVYVKSTRNRFGFWYDKNVWKLSNQLSNDAAEFELQMLKGDGYSMFISEKIEIDLENLKEVVIKNAQAEDPNIQLEKEENRQINGQKVKFMQLAGEAHGVKFVYQGYYTSNESGTLQFVCFTGRNLLKDYEKDFQNLLNGLVVGGK